MSENGYLEREQPEWQMDVEGLSELKEKLQRNRSDEDKDDRHDDAIDGRTKQVKWMSGNIHVADVNK